MQLINIKRAVVMRLAVYRYTKRKEIPIRTVHVTVLFLIYTISKGGLGPTTTGLYSLLIRIRRGSDPNYLTRLLNELAALDLISVEKYGRLKRFNVTSAGIIVLNEFEKTLRICRIDRRTLYLKKNKYRAKKK